MCCSVRATGGLDSPYRKLVIDEYDDCSEWAVVEKAAEHLLGLEPMNPESSGARGAVAVARIRLRQLARKRIK